MATTKYSQNGKSVAAYAAKIKGLENSTEAEKNAARIEVTRQICAYEVFAEVNNVVHLDRYFVHLVAIHAAPPGYWRELVERMVDEGWTVEQTKAAVKKVQPPKPPNPIRTTSIAIPPVQSI
jgi:hypothetical protein